MRRDGECGDTIETMPVHSGPVTAVMILLLIAGAQKVFDPSTTSGALKAARLPSSPVLVRLLGLVEVGAGVAFLVWGGPIPVAVAAVLYAGFAWFVLNALIRKLPISSCGCLGSTETPPTFIHVGMNLAAVGVLIVGVVSPVGPLGGTLGAGWGEIIPYLLLVGVSTYMLYALLTVLPLVSRRLQEVTPVSIGARSRA